MTNKQLNHKHHQSSHTKYPVCLLAHNIDLPGNVGSLFRIADALGVERIFLSGTSPVPPNDKIKRTSRSTEKYVPYDYEEKPLELIKRLKSAGYTIISLEITSSSMDIRDLSLSRNEKTCLILGSESEGVCQSLLDVSDKTIHIPMQGKNSSMNIVTACTIAVFDITRNYNLQTKVVQFKNSPMDL
ncbi:MAG TPA: TrmH family RNA methyltransferase [Gammaproteobacteria bacterium]|nr:TrmH family RNA methyltransferase [Gammaproteobacteria bacterium]